MKARGASASRVPLLVLALSAALCPSAAAEDSPPPVKLDRLLKLPSTVDYDMDRKGGAGRTEWRARFKSAEDEVASTKKALDGVMGKLEKAAEGSDSWRFVPPGGDVSAENQENVRLRMDVTKKRDEAARAEKRLKDLEVEANLASVPDDWRR